MELHKIRDFGKTKTDKEEFYAYLPLITKIFSRDSDYYGDEFKSYPKILFDLIDKEKKRLAVLSESDITDEFIASCGDLIKIYSLRKEPELAGTLIEALPLPEYRCMFYVELIKNMNDFDYAMPYISRFDEDYRRIKSRREYFDLKRDIAEQYLRMGKRTEGIDKLNIHVENIFSCETLFGSPFSFSQALSVAEKYGVNDTAEYILSKLKLLSKVVDIGGADYYANTKIGCHYISSGKTEEALKYINDSESTSGLCDGYLECALGNDMPEFALSLLKAYYFEGSDEEEIINYGEKIALYYFDQGLKKDLENYLELLRSIVLKKLDSSGYDKEEDEDSVSEYQEMKERYFSLLDEICSKYDISE